MTTETLELWNATLKDNELKQQAINNILAGKPTIYGVHFIERPVVHKTTHNAYIAANWVEENELIW